MLPVREEDEGEEGDDCHHPIDAFVDGGGGGALKNSRSKLRMEGGADDNGTIANLIIPSQQQQQENYRHDDDDDEGPDNDSDADNNYYYDYDDDNHGNGEIMLPLNDPSTKSPDPSKATSSSSNYKKNKKHQIPRQISNGSSTTGNSAITTISGISSPLPSVARSVSDDTSTFVGGDDHGGGGGGDSVTSGGSTYISRNNTYNQSTTNSGSRLTVDGGQEAIWESLRGRLLGREEQQQCLQECYERILWGEASKEEGADLKADPHPATATATTTTSINSIVYRSEIVIITGAGGMGKSCLARSLWSRQPDHDNHHRNKENKAGRVVFLSAKCQQVARPEPFAPFIRAFTRYFHRILKKRSGLGGDRRRYYRDAKLRVIDAVERATQDSDKGVLFNMIPTLRGFFDTNDEAAQQQEGGHPEVPPHSRRPNNVVSEHQHHQEESDVVVEDDVVPPISSLFVQAQADALRPTQSSTQSGGNGGGNGGGSSSSSRWRSRSNVDSPTILLFCRFLKELCSSSGDNENGSTAKILLLIDDWQWLDTASLKLIETIALQPNLKKGFMLLGTCRGNEVHPQAELSMTLRALESQGVRITDIAVGPLSLDVVRRCASSLLIRMEEEVQSAPTVVGVDTKPELEWLAKFTYERTGGNPFLVMELLRTLVDHRLLVQEAGSWDWNPTEIVHSDLALGSVEMLDVTVLQLANQSPEIRAFLQIAACLGSEFHISQVQRVGEMTTADSRLALSILYKRGILTRTEDRSRHRTTFAHDRWQDAALALIPIDQQDDYRLWIGRQLIVHLSSEEILEHTFLVAQLLFPKASTVQMQEDRNGVAEILGLAGMKASKCSAFDVAATYFAKAVSLLPENRWDPPTYPLCLQLFNCSAEIECSLGHADQVDRLVSEILLNTTNLQDQLRAYDTRIHSLSARNEFQESVKLGFHMLDLLGEPMPRRWGGLGDLRALLSVLWLVRNVKEDAVLKLRPMSNWKKMAAMKVIHFVSPSVIQSKPEAMLDLILKGVKLTLKHGLNPFSSMPFASLGMVLCNPLGMIDEGIRIEKIGYSIYEKLATKELMCRIYLVRYAHNLPWREPIKVCIPKIMEGARAGMLSGDVEMAGMNYAHVVVDKLLAGFPLNDLYEEATNLHAQFLELGQNSINFYIQSSIQLIRNLLGLADNPLILSGEDFDAIQSIQEASAKNYSACESWLLLAQQFLALLLGDFADAVVLTRKLAKCDITAFDGMLCLYLEFLRALSEAIMARQSKGDRRNRSRAMKSLNRLKKFIGHPRPERGWSNKILMVEAELLALKGLREEATFKWLSSIKDSERQGLVHEQALAHERLAHSLKEWDQERLALGHFREARSLYQIWGCVIKGNQMRRTVGEQTMSQHFQSRILSDEISIPLSRRSSSRQLEVIQAIS